MFNKNKKRNYRSKKRNEDDDDETEEQEESIDEESVQASLQERKELQSFRKRQVGVSVESLLVGEKIEPKKEADLSDPFKLKSGGGLTDISAKKVTKISELGTAFSTETNQRDEDMQMLRYIEDELKKKQGAEQKIQGEKRVKSKESELFQVPENINVKSNIMKSEEMLSSQMLSGIPEVDLGIEAKIKNIEATEEAKMKMMDDSKNRKKESSDFVPTNMASNFMHHNRFYNEKEAFEKERKKEEAKKKKLESTAVVDKGPTVGKEIVENEMDTKFMSRAMNSGQYKRKDKNDTADDYMFENFKKKSKERRWR